MLLPVRACVLHGHIPYILLFHRGDREIELQSAIGVGGEQRNTLLRLLCQLVLHIGFHVLFLGSILLPHRLLLALPEAVGHRVSSDPQAQQQNRCQGQGERPPDQAGLLLSLVCRKRRCHLLRAVGGGVQMGKGLYKAFAVCHAPHSSVKSCFSFARARCSRELTVFSGRDRS